MKNKIYITVVLMFIGLFSMNAQNIVPFNYRNKPDTAFLKVDVAAKNKSSDDALYLAILEKITFPIDMRRKKIATSLTVQFVITKEGKVEALTLAKRSNYEEVNIQVINILNTYFKENVSIWSAAILRNKRVHSVQQLVFDFNPQNFNLP